MARGRRRHDPAPRGDVAPVSAKAGETPSLPAGAHSPTVGTANWRKRIQQHGLATDCSPGKRLQIGIRSPRVGSVARARQLTWCSVTNASGSSPRGCPTSFCIFSTIFLASSAAASGPGPMPLRGGLSVPPDTTSTLFELHLRAVRFSDFRHASSEHCHPIVCDISLSYREPSE